jgi:hypothetical protein
LFWGKEFGEGAALPWKGSALVRSLCCFLTPPLNKQEKVTPNLGTGHGSWPLAPSPPAWLGFKEMPKAKVASAVPPGSWAAVSGASCHFRNLQVPILAFLERLWPAEQLWKQLRWPRSVSVTSEQKANDLLQQAVCLIRVHRRPPPHAHGDTHAAHAHRSYRCSLSHAGTHVTPLPHPGPCAYQRDLGDRTLGLRAGSPSSLPTHPPAPCCRALWS